MKAKNQGVAMKNVWNKVKGFCADHNQEILWGLYAALAVGTFSLGYRHGDKGVKVSRLRAWNYGSFYKLGRFLGKRR